MTTNLFDALLRDVPRYEPDNPPDNAPSMQPANDGDWVRYSDVLAALAAVPADLAETAGDLLPTLRKGPGYVYGFVDTDNRAADLITALLARIAAQEAQIKGLEAERDEPHWDDHCVNQFAKMMREKMAAARAKGRSGWNDPNQCSVDYLRDLLYEHLDKGDTVDVANFCMMLRHYDASTRRDYGNTLDMWKARAEAAETALAAERAKVAKLVEYYEASEAILSIEAEWRSRKADGLLDGSNIFNLTDKLTAAEARLAKARAAITEAGQ